MPFNLTRKQLTIIGAIAAVVVIAIAAVALTSGGDDETAASTTTTSTTAPPETTTTPPPAPPAPLTGISQPDDAMRNRPALVVKVDNTPKAREKGQAGLAAADVVFVEKVEGGATRLATVFQSTDATVGPVRSARTTDVEIVGNLNRPLFSFSGANAGVIREIRASNLVDVGYDAFPDSYPERGSGVLRFYIETPTLYGLTAEGADRPPPQFFPFRPADQPVASAGAEDASGVQLGYGGNAQTNVSYDFDPGSGGWLRTQNGTTHVDADGTPIVPANVIVQFTEYRDSGYIDISGAPSPEAVLVGEGEAWVFTGHKLVRGRWVRPDAGAVTQYLDATGQPIPLTPGRTWIELPEPGSASVRTVSP